MRQTTLMLRTSSSAETAINRPSATSTRGSTATPE